MRVVLVLQPAATCICEFTVRSRELLRFDNDLQNGNLGIPKWNFSEVSSQPSDGHNLGQCGTLAFPPAPKRQFGCSSWGDRMPTACVFLDRSWPFVTLFRHVRQQGGKPASASRSAKIDKERRLICQRTASWYLCVPKDRWLRNEVQGFFGCFSS